MAGKKKSTVIVKSSGVTEALSEQDALALAKGAFVVERPEMGDEGQMMAALSKLEKADAKQIKRVADELIKPSANATPDEPQEFRGIYYGAHKDGKFNAHYLAMRDENTGRPVLRKVRSSHVLNRKLDVVPIGAPIVLYYQGKSTPGEDGRRTNLWDVGTL